MHDVHHSLSVIQTILSLPTFGFNENGQAEIVFPIGVSAFLSKISDTVLEISFRLPGLDAPDASMMKAMLQANCLGAGTGAGRLAMDGAGDEVHYCERWDVREMDAGMVERRIQGIAEYGAFWLMDGTDAILAEANRLRADLSPPTFVRAVFQDEDESGDDGEDGLKLPEQPFFARV